MALLMKQAVAVIDKRTTVVCLHISGTIVPVDEPFETLAGDFMDPPFHIHCRTIVRPWIPGMINDLREEANAELQRRPKKQRRIGPGGEIGGTIPPPSTGNGPDGFSFPGSSDAAWKPKISNVLPVEKNPLSGADAAKIFMDDGKGLTEEQRSAFYSYGMFSADRINKALRNGAPITSPRAADVFSTMMAVMDGKEGIPEAVQVYRGLALEHLPAGDLTGTSLKELAFMSTALRRSDAEVYALELEDAGNSAILELVLPKGTKAISINMAAKDRQNMDPLQDESEIILPPGAVLRIVSDAMTTIGGKPVRYLKAVIDNG